MDTTSIQSQHSGFSRLRLFFALSRTPHGLLDMAAPALGALLWLGAFPSFKITVLGLITAFAGYTAVYALNDLVDIRVDREKIRGGNLNPSEIDVDAVILQHPMAQGFLSLKEGLIWVCAWSLLALAGAYHLNPVCIYIFIGGCILEAVYCLLLKITHFRTLISGAVKTSGPVAAVFAVDPSPSFIYLVILFFFLFFWEIGGQNVPNDLTDMEENRRIEARTIPVRLGPDRAGSITLMTLVITVAVSPILFLVSPKDFGLPFMAAVILSGLLLLIVPGIRLARTNKRMDAMALFNRASYYPLTLLLLVITRLFM